MTNFYENLNGFLNQCIEQPYKNLNLHLELDNSRHIDADLNQFQFILKPEITNLVNTSSLKEIVQLIEETFLKFSINIEQIYVLSGKFVRNNKWVQKHYSTLNRVSKLGTEALTNSQLVKISESFDDFDHILGAHEFLSSNLKYDFNTLQKLTSKLETKKIGAGVYATKVLINGEKLILLNSFHPFQENWFNKDSHSIIVMNCVSQTQLKDLRTFVLGNTDPKFADKNSLKSQIFERKEELNLPDFSIMFNGFHLSPNLIEATSSIIELSNLSRKPITIHSTSFGKMLLKNGFSDLEIEKYLKNPTVPLNNEYIPLFEVLEDLNWDQALNYLQSLKSEEVYEQ